MKAELAIILITLAAMNMTATGQNNNSESTDGRDLHLNDASGGRDASFEIGDRAEEEPGSIGAADIQALVEKGQDFARRGNYRETVRAFDRASGLDPLNASIRVAKGNALSIELARYNESLLAYDAAIQIDGKEAEAWVGKGDSLQALGRREEAVSAYDNAIKLDQKSSEAWRGKGDALRRSGDLEGALRAYDNAIRADPLDEKAWKGKSITLQALERDSEAYDVRVDARELGISI